MKDLRKAARGRECQVRYPGICNFNAETTVLAHLRHAGITGAGQKAPDLLGAWACSACHQEADRQTMLLDRETAVHGFYEGILRTQYQLIKQGIIKV